MTERAKSRVTEGQDAIPRHEPFESAATEVMLGLGCIVLASLGVLGSISVLPGWYTVPALGALSLVLLVSLWLSIRRHARILAAEQQRDRELASAIGRAERLAEEERQARESQERVTESLRAAIREYTAFLDRVAEADLSRPGVSTLGSPMADETTQDRDLQALSSRLSSTVGALVKASQNVQVAQGRYLAEAWSGSAQTGHAFGLRYRDGMVETANEAWLASMQSAVQERDVCTRDGELALPISWRGKTIGVIGLRRQRQGAFGEGDVNLVRAVVDQLAQTLESLTLVDQAQRHATRDRLARRISDRLRNAGDMEAMLQAALRETAAALGASRAFVQWVSPSPPGDEGAL